MRALPLLGGKNGQAISINDRGQAVGVAEDGTLDKNCVAPQTNDFEAVLWGPGQGEIQKLRPLPGDSVGIGLWVNGRARWSDNGFLRKQPPSSARRRPSRRALGKRVRSLIWATWEGACITPCLSAAHWARSAISPLYRQQRSGIRYFGAGRGTNPARLLMDKGDGHERPRHRKGRLCERRARRERERRGGGFLVDKTGAPRGVSPAERRHDRSQQPASGQFSHLRAGAEFINSSDEIVGFGVTSSGQIHAFLATPCP